MARSLSNVNISTDSFLTWITQTNKLLEALRTDVITVSTSIVGGNSTLANTTGNAQLIGLFGANSLVATDALRGGNATATNVLNIVSNTSITGDNLKVGANVQINAVSVFVGNTTVNLVATQSILSVSNTLSIANLSPRDLVIGTAVVNSTILTIGTGNFSVGANVGANVNVNTSTLQIGNSVANIVANSTLIQVSNSTTTANLSPRDLVIGTAVVNSTVLTIGTGNFSVGANVGANVNVTTTQYGITGTTVIPTMTLNTAALVIGNSSVTGAPTVNLANSAGNTTVNTNNIGTSWGLIANSLGVYHTGVVNAFTHSSGATFTANSSLVNATAINVTGQVNTATLFSATSANVGGNVQITTSAMTLGADAGTATNSIKVANSLGNTVITSASITGSGWNFNANSLGVYHTGVVNAFTHSSGATFTANSSLVNAAAINVTGQVNTATLFSATSANVGANVQVTTAQYGITGTTVIPTMTLNTAALVIGNSSVTGAPTINLANSAGNTTVNATSIGTNWGFTANSLGVYHTATVNAAFHTTSTTVSNTSGYFPTSNTLAIGNTIGRWIVIANSVSANSVTVSGTISSGNVDVTGYVNASANLVAPLVFANLSAGYANVTGQVNAATLFVGTSANVGANVQVTTIQYGITGTTTIPTMTLNTAALVIGNSSVTGAPTINLANSAGNTTVNTTSVGTSWGLTANSLGVYHTGVVNAFTHSSGATFTANGSLVNAAAINVTGQVNTATFFATTSANVGSNVQLTTARLAISEGSNTNISNSTIITIANTTGTSNLQPGLLSIGGSTVNTTYVVANNVVVNSDYEIQVLSNTNIGTNISSALVIYTFPKATYSSAKVTAQVKRTGNTQTSEMVIAHDGTDAFVTVYGTVISPSTAADLGDFSVGINNANVELKYQQTAVSSAVKIIAHLIK